jgi:Mg-chelatase subunit ChlD
MARPRCPITLNDIDDPVIAADGHTYERAAITEWFRQHDTSPLTGVKLSTKVLTTNWAIKQIIEEYKAGAASAGAASAGAASAGAASAGAASAGAASAGAASAGAASAASAATADELIVRQSKFLHNGLPYHMIKLINGSNDTLRAGRMPVFIALGIDVSGSMGERATAPKSSGENDDFSRLDLVKHSIATIQKSLQPGDKLAIVAFSNVGNIVLDATEVSANESLITSRINSLQAGGGTNIWTGLQICIDLANRQDTARFNTSVMLLTDGADTCTLPRGLLATFETYFKPMIGKFSIHTFAYGYEVESKVLAQIAAMSQGVFGYIPDATMVGTVFINTISGILSSTCNVSIKVKRLRASQMETINLGSMLYGQSRDVLINTTSGALESIEVSNNRGKVVIVQCSDAVKDQVPDINAIAKYELTKLLRIYTQQQYYSSDMNPRLEDFVARFVSYFSDSNPFIRDMMIDCCDADPNKGQIGKSIANNAWFTKWGQHFLRSMESAIRQEWCLNFKDLAPQHFTSATFASYREKIEGIFLSITPPVPSHRKASTAAATVAYRQPSYAPAYVAPTPVYRAPAPSSMQSLYNPHGGCFTGNWNVMLANGIMKSVKDICPGDSVLSNDSPTGRATILCIVRLRINESFEMCSPDGSVGITSYHPFWMTNYTLTRKWQFPVLALDKSVRVNAGEYMYDFITDRGFSVSLEGGYNVACLGHGCRDSDIITHEYFGTHRVIDDLKQHTDFTSGYITLDTWEFVREDCSGRVCKLKW